MIQDRKVLSITPARGGSKSIKRKNVLPLNGKPLVAWPIGTARESRYIDEIVVSTDDAEIASVAKDFGARTVARPSALASDSALVADAVRDLLASLSAEGESFEIAVLLEPTSPLRTAAIVDACLEKLMDEDADSVATFSLADPPPTRLWRIEEGTVAPYVTGANPWLPRQSHDSAYALNGLVYAFRPEVLLRELGPSFLVGRCVALITDTPTVDIDTAADFDLASALLEAMNR